MKKVKFWIVNEANPMQAVILMYGYIGEYEAIDDAAFVADLQNLYAKFPEILIRVNCGGGDVYKGMTIYNTIKEKNNKIKIKIDGIAASMGAIFPLGAKKENVSISKYGRMMTHRVMTAMFGNADELKAQATELENWEDNISSILAERTGLSKENAKKKYIVNNDRWISGQQAKDEGLVGEVYDADPVSMPANNNEHELFSSYQVVLNKVNFPQQNTNDMKAIALLLGLAENATETEILAAINKMKTEKENAVNAQATANKAKAKALVDAAIKNKQLTENDRADFEAMAETNYEQTSKVIAKIAPAKKPSEVITPSNKKVEGEETDSGDVDTWEKLVAKGEKFVAEFKKSNVAEYEKLLADYTAKPVEEKK